LTGLEMFLCAVQNSVHQAQRTFLEKVQANTVFNIL